MKPATRGAPLLFAALGPNALEKNTLYYIIAFPMPGREKAWQEFRSDPEWIKAESGKEGVLVNKKVGPS